MKTYPQDVEDQIAEGIIALGYLIELQTDVPLYFTSTGFDVEVPGAETYISESMFQGMEELIRSASLSVSEITLQFSSVTSTIMFLAQNDSLKNRRLIIKRVFFDSSTNLISHVEDIWIGKITANSDEDENSIINLTVKNIWADFEMVNSWRTTMASHERRHQGDKCFKYAAKAVETIYWAGTVSGGGRGGGGGSSSGGAGGVEDNLGPSLTRT